MVRALGISCCPHSVRRRRLAGEEKSHYSQGHRARPALQRGHPAGDTLYVSGQGGFDAGAKKIPDKFEDEVRSCVNIVATVLQAGGMDLLRRRECAGPSHRNDPVSAHDAVYMDMFKEPRSTRTLP